MCLKSWELLPRRVGCCPYRELNKAIAHQRPKSNVMNEEFKRKRGGKRATAAAADPDEGSKAAPTLSACACSLPVPLIQISSPLCLFTA